MNGTFNLNELIHQMSMRKQWHEQEAAKAKAVIMQLEQRLEETYEKLARHQGAAGALAESLQVIQKMLEQPSNPNPMRDPLAHSDQ